MIKTITMKYLSIFALVLALSACGGDAGNTSGHSSTSNADSLDSVHKAEDEVAEEIIEGSFDALNR